MTADEAKDFVLEYLLRMQRKHPARHMGYPKSMIINAADDDLGERNAIRAAVAMAVDYLEDEGYLRTQSQQHVKYYRLSAKAQDKLLPPSKYATNPNQLNELRVLPGGGVLVMGDNYGSIAVDNRIQITNDLEQIADLIAGARDVAEPFKADLMQNIATLQAQMKKPDPDKTIVERAWTSLQAASAIGGAGQLLGQVKPLVDQIIKMAAGT